MTDEQQWNKLYKYLDKRFGDLTDDMNGKLAIVNERLEGIERTVDSLHGKFDELQTEQVAMKHQLVRHERWHHQTADHVGLKLEYDT